MESGDPTKMATLTIDSKLSPMQRFERMTKNLNDLLPCLSVRTAFDCSVFLLLLNDPQQICSLNRFL